MDSLTTMFGSVRVRQAAVDRVEATAPWGFRADQSPNVRFVLVLSGSLVLRTPGESQPVWLKAGSLSIVFGGSGYSIADHPRSRVVEHTQLHMTRQEGVVRGGGGGALTRFIGGRFLLDQLEAQPLLQALPKTLHLHLDARRTHSFQSVLELIAAETEQPGLASAEMNDSLCAILLIHAIRAYVNDEGSDPRGWLAGLKDGHLSKALLAIHAHLERTWTVEEMATQAGLSRSGFAARFKYVVGQSPIEYLAQWRVHQAAVLMRKTNLTIGTIAKRVGYASESAFTKVFKKMNRMTPSEFMARGNRDA